MAGQKRAVGQRLISEALRCNRERELRTGKRTFRVGLSGEWCIRFWVPLASLANHLFLVPSLFPEYVTGHSHQPLLMVCSAVQLTTAPRPTGRGEEHTHRSHGQSADRPRASGCGPLNRSVVVSHWRLHLGRQDSDARTVAQPTGVRAPESKFGDTRRGCP